MTVLTKPATVFLSFLWQKLHVAPSVAAQWLRHCAADTEDAGSSLAAVAASEMQAKKPKMLHVLEIYANVKDPQGVRINPRCSFGALNPAINQFRWRHNAGGTVGKHSSESLVLSCEQVFRPPMLAWQPCAGN